jgi:hypothetical protein
MRDSLEIVELMMAIEQAFDLDASLTATQRERLLSEIQKRIEKGELGSLDDLDLDEGTLGVLVRKLGPRGPLGQAGAKAFPVLRESDELGSSNSGVPRE